MKDANFTFDTTQYDELPISIFIFKIEIDSSGNFEDYTIVYGNKIFEKDWNLLYKNNNYIGSKILKNHLLDDYSLRMIEKFQTEEPFSFSTYMPWVNFHLHFQPLLNLPKEYIGFFVTNITDYEEQESRVHFLKNIRQMKNIAVLIKKHENEKLETVFVSDDFAKMMECTVEEAKELMNGPGFFTSTVPEDRPLVKSMLKRKVSYEGTSNITIQKTTAKGHSIWVTVHYAFIDDFNEHYIYCTYFNVTVLKEYEERLRSVYTSIGNNFYQQNERTLSLLRINATRDITEDIKGFGLYTTDTTELPYSELLKMRVVNYPIKTEQEQFLQKFSPQNIIKSYLSGIPLISQSLYSKRQDGRMVFVNYSANITRHPMNGDVIAFITEQEYNDEKVTNALLEKILVQQFDMVSYVSEGKYGVVIGDSSLIHKGNIFPLTRTGIYEQYLNDQVFPVLSGTEEQIQKMKKALSLEEIRKNVAESEPYIVNISCKIDGEDYYKRFDVYSVSPEANFYIILKSDTTQIQQKQIEHNKQLSTALEEAKQASVAKTAFLSSMSHEIRTPMNAIIGLDNIALKEPDLPQRTKEYLEKIGLSARHLLGLINDILDMSRIESGRMVIKNEEFSFKNFLEQINIIIYGQCQDKGLIYDCKMEGKIGDYYIGDSMKLKQVLINILGNAVKFTPKDGSVSLKIQKIAEFESQTTFRFTIKDTGIGMEKSYIPKIFEAFSQEDATTTNKYGGSGLGLAITKNIVEMMNGSITVDSEKGVGSTFTVEVTLKDSEKKEDGVKTEITPQEMKVLIIDDDKVACEHAKIVLEEIGISSEYCLSGKEAIENIKLKHARMETYNIILVDLRMPEQDGIEVTEQIRNLIGNESAIIILTAYNWTDVEQKAIEAGVDSFMSKPLFASNVMNEFHTAFHKKHIKQKEEEHKVNLKGKRILLAEDMLINAEIMKELLSMMEIQVEHAENGKIALEMFSQKPEHYFDAILMDVRMPEMDGLEATSEIRKLSKSDAKTIPIIAMTANAFDEDVQRSLQAGMDAHLSKPVEPERLQETLSTLIGGGRSKL